MEGVLQLLFEFRLRQAAIRCNAHEVFGKIDEREVAQHMGIVVLGIQFWICCKSRCHFKYPYFFSSLLIMVLGIKKKCEYAVSLLEMRPLVRRTSKSPRYGLYSRTLDSDRQQTTYRVRQEAHRKSSPGRRSNRWATYLHSALVSGPLARTQPSPGKFATL